MALLSKDKLYQLVETSLRDNDWNVNRLSEEKERPARYHIFRADQSHTIKVYIWNLTHGGKKRPKDEYRIQPTGVTQFQPEAGGKTLILGWWIKSDVFAGFDYLSVIKMNGRVEVLS
jgi:putative restriction endonuclease